MTKRNQTTKRGGTATKTANNSKIVKAVALILAILAVAYFITSVALGFVWNPLKWTKSGTRKPMPDMSNTSNGNISLASYALSAEDYEAYGISKEAKEAYVVNAAFTPAETTYQEVDFAAYFDTTSKPEYSTWANGEVVTDYATITPTADGSCTATVEVKKAFSAPIIVKATSRHDSNVYATIRLNYVCEDCIFHLGNNSKINDIDGDISFSIEWKNGTVVPDVEDSVVVAGFNFGDSFKNNMQQYGYTVDSIYYLTLEFDDNWNASAEIVSIETMLRSLGGEEAKLNYNAYWNAVSKAILNGNTPENNRGSEIGIYDIRYSRVYNGVTYSSFDEDFLPDNTPFDVEDWSYFEVQAKGLTFTDENGEPITELVFG